MEAKASAKYTRGSAQKARLVVDMIRGKSVNQALATLQFTNKRATDPVEACVRSAIANATEAAEKANVAVDPDDLWIKEAFVDKGPTKGRFRTRPAPQGRAYRERRHFCHVSIIVSSDDMPVAKNAKPNGAGASRRAADNANAPKRATVATTTTTAATSDEANANATTPVVTTTAAAPQTTASADVATPAAMPVENTATTTTTATVINETPVQTDAPETQNTEQKTQE